MDDKLSKAQREVLQALADGCRFGIEHKRGHLRYYLTDAASEITLWPQTTYNLRRRGFIEAYGLNITEAGRAALEAHNDRA